jgi:type II secretory pathway component PulF
LLFALLGVAVLAGLGRVAGQAARRVAIGLPWLGEALKWAATRHFASTLHLYIASGLPIATALPNALASARFTVPRQRLESVTDAVRRGVPLAAALKDLGLFPDKFVHMVEVGESSGRIADILASAVDEAKGKVEQRLALVSSVLAPILILVVGGLIGAVIFSVFSSLLQINELVT